MEDEFKPNSHKYKEAQKDAEKRVKKVVKGPVKTKEKSLGRKFAETFITEDVHDVKSYIFSDVIIPAIKDTLSQTVKQAIDMILFGNSKTISKEKPYGRVSYSSYYDRDERKERAARPTRSKDFYDIILDSRAEAEEVLESLRDIIDQYGQASLEDYHDLCGVTGPYTGNRYGWTDLTHVGISYIRGQGFIIDLPKAYPLDQ